MPPWLHAFNHALFKGLLFLSIGTATDMVAASGGNALRDVYTIRGAAATLRKAGDRTGITVISFVVGALSIAAIPPLNGYASKVAITELLRQDWRYWVLYAASIGTIASMIKLSLIFFPKPRWRAEQKQQAEQVALGETPIEAPAFPALRVKLPQKLAMGSLALLCIGSGLFSVQLGAFVSGLLGSASPVLSSAVFSIKSLSKMLPVLGLGGILFAFIISSVGKKLSSLVRSRPKSFSGLVFSFALALAVLAVVLR
ncbi:hypothetical protein MASR2M78_25440 [Treponema sp.]